MRSVDRGSYDQDHFEAYLKYIIWWLYQKYGIVLACPSLCHVLEHMSVCIASEAVVIVGGFHKPRDMRSSRSRRQ